MSDRLDFRTPRKEKGLRENYKGGRVVSFDFFLLSRDRFSVAFSAQTPEVVVVGGGVIGSATAYCNATDALPTQCDFVVHNQELVTPVVVLLIEFVVLIIAAFNASEMEQALEWRPWCQKG